MEAALVIGLVVKRSSQKVAFFLDEINMSHKTVLKVLHGSGS